MSDFIKSNWNKLGIVSFTLISHKTEFSKIVKNIEDAGCHPAWWNSIKPSQWPDEPWEKKWYATSKSKFHPMYPLEETLGADPISVKITNGHLKQKGFVQIEAREENVSDWAFFNSEFDCFKIEAVYVHGIAVFAITEDGDFDNSHNIFIYFGKTETFFNHIAAVIQNQLHAESCFELYREKDPANILKSQSQMFEV